MYKETTINKIERLILFSNVSHRFKIFENKLYFDTYIPKTNGANQQLMLCKKGIFTNIKSIDKESAISDCQVNNLCNSGKIIYNTIITLINHHVTLKMVLYPKNKYDMQKNSVK